MKLIRHFIKGEWAFGWESWEGKPKLYLAKTYYEGWHYTLHIGPFWASCYY